MCALCLGFFQKVTTAAYMEDHCCGKQTTSLCLLMRRGTCSVGWILSGLKRDLMLGTGHERCTNTSSRSSGFLFSITTTFLLLIPKNEPEEFMWAPAPLFQNNDSSTGMCACAALFFITGHQKSIAIWSWGLQTVWKTPTWVSMEDSPLFALRKQGYARPVHENWDSGLAYKSLRSAPSSTSLLPHFLCAFTKTVSDWFYGSPRPRSSHSKTLPSIPILCRSLGDLFPFYQKSYASLQCWFSVSSLFYSKMKRRVSMAECAVFFLLPRSLHKKCLRSTAMRGVVRLENGQGFSHGLGCAEWKNIWKDHDRKYMAGRIRDEDEI